MHILKINLIYRYEEAVPLLEGIFKVREKLLTLSHMSVLQCLCELVAVLDAVRRPELALSYAVVAAKAFDLAGGAASPDAETMRVPFLQLASRLSAALGHDKRPYERQLAELRYSKGAKLENAQPLLEVIRERYIHRASHTAKLA